MHFVLDKIWHDITSLLTLNGYQCQHLSTFILLHQIKFQNAYVSYVAPSLFKCLDLLLPLKILPGSTIPCFVFSIYLA